MRSLPRSVMSGDIRVMRSAHLAYLIALCTFIFDRVTKYLVVSFLDSPIDLGLFHIVHVTNTGITWGLLKGYSVIPIAVSLFVICYILYILKVSPKQPSVMIWVFGLVLGGAVGNLIDRVVYGAVIDFIDLGWWPVFNLADSAIVIAMVLLVYINFFPSSSKTSK